MKLGKSIRFTALLLIFMLILTACTNNNLPGGEQNGSQTDTGDGTVGGEDLSELGAYDGYFDEDTADVTVTCISGTEGCWSLLGNTLTFTQVGEDSVYSVSGKLRGSILIDVGDDYKFELEMTDFSLVSESESPITVLSGDKVSLAAKKGTQNYIYDKREAVDENDENAHSGAIYSSVDLEICGKGSLTLISENNNGIHTKDDLTVKNLTLFVSCVDNALKGNDSVELTGGVTTLIATAGDGIKTENSDISSKGNRRGTVTVTGGEHTIYAACDGIDAAYDTVIEGGTVLNIYTDKYSGYSKEVTAVDENVYYIRFTSNSYLYSVRYYNSDSDTLWVNASYHSSVSGLRSTYYYYSFPKMQNYAKMQFFIYSSTMEQGQDGDYLAASDYLTPAEGYDTFALSSQGGGLVYNWTNYTTNILEGGPGGMGSMQGGNSDKSDHSTKGIKAANEIIIRDGQITVKSYDDAIHANNDTSLESGEVPLGNVLVSGGVLSLYSNDDGIHADGTLSVSGGSISVSHSYEGLEGNNISISGGRVSVISSDDGINGTASSGTAISISGGEVYVYAGGDGIDSNSRTSYSGIVFSGGDTVVISTSGNNSAIDTEQGYSYTGGRVLAVMPSGGMSNETTNCTGFSSVGVSCRISLSADGYLCVRSGGELAVTVKMPKSMSCLAVYLSDPSASLTAEESTSVSLDGNGVKWGT